MNKVYYYLIGIIGALGIAFGAMGAHLMKDYLITYNKTFIFETATKYHIYHSLFALIILFFNEQNNKYLFRAFIFAFTGIVLFSFSLYINCILPLFGIELKWINYITPFGGLFFILSWLMILPYAIKK